MALIRRGGKSPAGTSSILQPFKIDFLDWTFERFGLQSFADLGGTWAVEAGYSFHLLERFAIARGVLVDSGITDPVRDRARRHPEFELVDGFFGDPEVADRVGPVDAVVLFDVLLHQVRPDWDAIIETYAAQAKTFIVVQPQWTVAGPTVRLLDLGTEDYIRNVPAGHIPVDLADLDVIDPRYGRPARDIHEIWQWGITDHDLAEKVISHGFRLIRKENSGRWQDLPHFDNVGFVFVRDDVWEAARD